MKDEELYGKNLKREFSEGSNFNSRNDLAEEEEEKNPVKVTF